MSSPLSGAYLLTDVDSLTNDIKNGDWAATALDALSTGLDVAAAVMDPIGTLIANGLGWLIDHLDPLKTWFDDLTGHADEVAAFSRTWKSTATQLHHASATYQSRLTDFAPIKGAAGDAYRTYAHDLVQHIDSAGGWADAIATGLEIASQLVQTIHDLVRDVLSQIVGSIISAVLEAIATVGFGLPEIIAQLAEHVAQWAARIGKDLTHVVETISDLVRRIDRLVPEIERIGKTLSEALHNAKGAVRDLGDAAAGGFAAIKKLVTGKGQVLEDGLTDAKRAEILSLPKGERPDPHTYLSDAYYQQQMQEFEGGASKFMLEKSHERYGPAQVDGTSFVMPSSQVDEIMRTTGGDPRLMEQALGLPDGYLNDKVVRLDIPKTDGLDLRIPSGNEAGANEQWIPGGHLPTGVSEAVLDGATLKAHPELYSVSPMSGGAR